MRNSHIFVALRACVVAACLAASCSDQEVLDVTAAADPSGKVQLSFEDSYSLPDGVRAQYEISADDMEAPITGDVPFVDGGASITIANIPAGANRQLVVRLVDAAGLILCQGDAEVLVVPARTVRAQVMLQCESKYFDGALDVDCSMNFSPIIYEIAADPEAVDAGATTTITAMVVDPDDDPLTFAWEASSGTLTGSAGPSVQYTTNVDANAPQTVTLTVRDGRGGANTALVQVRVTSCVSTTCQEQGIGCGAIADGCGAVLTCGDPCSGDNFDPVITAIIADPSEIAVTETSTVAVMASDQDGGPLSYQWSASHGTFDDDRAAVTTYHPDPAFTGAQDLAVLVSDGREGSATATLTIVVATCAPTTCAEQGVTCGTIADDCGGTLTCGEPCPGDNNPPVITTIGAEPTSISVTETTTVSVVAGDADGDALSYEWSAPDGTFDDATVATTTYRPSAETSGTVTIIVTVRDGRGGVVVGTLTIEVLACIPTTCAEEDVTCGTIPDGCGGTVVCGSLCNTSEVPDFCSLSGGAQDVAECQVGLVASSAAGPFGAAMQLDAVFSPDQVAFEGFSCPSERIIGGNPIVVDSCAGDLGAAAIVAGHTIKTQTSESPMRVIINHDTDPSKRLTEAYNADDGVVGESHLVTLRFRLLEAIDASAPQYVGIQGLTVTDSSATPLVTSVESNVIMTSN